MLLKATVAVSEQNGQGVAADIRRNEIRRSVAIEIGRGDRCWIFPDLIIGIQIEQVRRRVFVAREASDRDQHAHACNQPTQNPCSPQKVFVIHSHEHSMENAGYAERPLQRHAQLLGLLMDVPCTIMSGCSPQLQTRRDRLCSLRNAGIPDLKPARTPASVPMSLPPAGRRQPSC